MPQPDIFKARQYWCVEESEFSEFASSFYGKPWRLVEAEESIANGMYLVFDTEGKWLDEDEIKRFEEWLAQPGPDLGNLTNMERLDLERKCPVYASIVFWDLARKGAIESGEYLVHVWW